MILSLSLAAHAAEPLPSKVQARVDHALDAVDATGTQRSTVYDVLEDALPRLRSFHEEARDLHQRIHDVLLAPQIDRDALEDLRVDAVGLFDRATAVGFATVADLAEVFTPDQRAALAELRHQQWAERIRAWHDADAG